MLNLNADRQLYQAVDQLLSEHPHGLTEYDLMQLLDSRFGTLYPKPDLQDSLLLFRHHFFLRHTLYRLQQDLAAEQPRPTSWLEITPVKLCKRPVTSGSHNLPGAHDPLAAYYLDLSNMFKQTADSVQTLLDDFWQAMFRLQAKPDALALLGLDGSESPSEQKRRYRALAQQHHPDKGGDADQFQAIQQAWEALRK